MRLNRLGSDHFHELTCDEAAAVNSQRVIEERNLMLDIEPVERAIWLSGDQLIELCAAYENHTELSASPLSQESLRRLPWCTCSCASARQLELFNVGS